MTRRWSMLAVLLTLSLTAAACGGDDGGGGAQPTGAADTGTGEPTGPDTGGGGDGGTVEVVAKWTGTEAEAAQTVFAAFTEETGIAVNFQGLGDDLPTILSTRVEGGDPPAVAVLPQPGLMSDLHGRGVLKPLEDLIGSTVDESFAPVWRELGSVDGELYGLWFKAANKSTVWYSPPALDAAGVEPPTTWDEWVTAATDIADTGLAPIAVGGQDGWTLTDWFENVYLRTAGPEMYDQLTNHEIAWTDQSVKDAFAVLEQLIGQDDFVARGRAGALQVPFTDSVQLVFGASPEAAMVYEGDFVAGEILSATDTEPGGFNFFDFPSINGSAPAVVGGGDVVVLMSDDPNAQELVTWLATPEAAAIWAELGGFSSPNQDMDPAAYPNDVARAAGVALANAETFRFDMSDLVPAAFGGTAAAGMWGGLQDWLQDPSQVDAVLAQLEQEAAAAQD